MATKPGAGAPIAPKTTPANGNPANPVTATPAQDVQLLKCIREKDNLQIIVRALTAQGLTLDWNGMNTYSALAHRLTQFGAVPALQPAQTMAAGAGGK